MRLLLLATVLLVAGCAADPPPRELRAFHANGFVIQDDGCLTPKEREGLLAELTAAREKILATVGRSARTGDFRTLEERARASCPLVPAAETRVVVLRNAGRCHADETGLTIVYAHLERKDATHELVHYLVGGAWRPVDEGLAVYLTEKLHGPSGGVGLDIRSRVYMDLSLENGLDRERLRQGMSRCDYDVAGSFTKFLIETYGIGPFMTLYDGPPGDYHGVYGCSEQELLAKWREKIRAIPVRQDGSYYKFKDFMTRP